jgi:prepilin-type N-terminal cleavage/methylation domain-containing protein
MLSSIIERLNEKRTAKLDGEAESGFTLIELMVVLLIMAILLAIAIPTFLGVKGGAQDRAAQSDLNTTLTNAKAIYGNNQSYPSPASVTGAFSAAEASLTFTFITSMTTAFPTKIDPGNVAIAVSGDYTGIMMVNVSQTGKDCWWLISNEATDTTDPGFAGGGAGWPVYGNPVGAGTFYASTKYTAGACTAPAGTSPWMINTAGSWFKNAFTSAF